VQPRGQDDAPAPALRRLPPCCRLAGREPRLEISNTLRRRIFAPRIAPPFPSLESPTGLALEPLATGRRKNFAPMYSLPFGSGLPVARRAVLASPKRTLRIAPAASNLERLFSARSTMAFGSGCQPGRRKYHRLLPSGGCPALGRGSQWAQRCPHWFCLRCWCADRHLLEPHQHPRAAGEGRDRF